MELILSEGEKVNMRGVKKGMVWEGSSEEVKKIEQLERKEEREEER